MCVVSNEHSFIPSIWIGKQLFTMIDNFFNFRIIWLLLNHIALLDTSVGHDLNITSVKL